MPAGRGFADVVFLPLPSCIKPAVIVELKYDRAVRSAISQIREKQYPQVLEGYSGEIVLVGVNYDKDSKEHSCVIEKISK